MYTPTTEVVRTDYIRTQFTDTDKAGEEFDRWLAGQIEQERKRIVQLIESLDTFEDGGEEILATPVEKLLDLIMEGTATDE
jgi:hypothetical protein